MADLGTNLTVAAVKAATGPASNALSRWGQKRYDKFLANYTNALSEYINASVQQCSNVKNILYRNQLADTDEKYVNVCFSTSPEFQSDADEITDSCLTSSVLRSRHIMVRGRGGAGKTMFTKWAVLRIAESLPNHQKIPIYVELREIPNNGMKDSFEELIFDVISNHRTKTSFNQFLEGLKAGLFVIVLDAADEINKTDRGRILKLLAGFSKMYPEIGILVTTREFDEIEGLGDFENYYTKPLSFEQAIEIIDKLDYDQETKAALKEEFQSGQQSRDNFFLENPLLVTILLLTYDQSKEIPTKRSLFYKRAFEALYERHDGAKGIYKRDHHAGLPMDEFEKVFSTFCFGTYINSKYDFDETDLPQLFAAACQESGISEDPAMIARDASESVCLLVKEGHDYVFAHRSFQEYFAVVFIKNYKSPDIAEIVNAALNYGRGENILEFLFEMDQESLERHYVLPNLNVAVEGFDKHDLEKDEDCLKLLREFFPKIVIRQSNGLFLLVHFGKFDGLGALLGLGGLYPGADPFEIIGRQFTKPLPENLLERMRTSRSIKKSDEHSEPSLEISFAPTSTDWLRESNLRGNLAEYVRGVKALQTEIRLRLDRPTSKVTERFKQFNRR